ncbi:MAG: hypothetical protein Edafosvirus1_62 [Edafosvirus sp.]|uniref:Uncharacterized protein n=1 Tax=Edafosvirus sp. TaxID=2487765 RepID=A0A3G4ZUQ8_9VIRU|nr:MAG: hypothetical protein Edafosvirus1_62 [Edafosvirus sp.]
MSADILPVETKQKPNHDFKKGLLLESKIHEHFIKFGAPDPIQCLKENDVIKKFGINVTAIDHYMYYNNKIVLLQDKWSSRAPSIYDIDHFIVSVNAIKNQLTGFEIKAIYVSKKQPTKPALESLKTNGHISINNDSDENSIEDLIKQLEPQILSFFGIDGTSAGDINNNLKKINEENIKKLEKEILLDKELENLIKKLQSYTKYKNIQKTILLFTSFKDKKIKSLDIAHIQSNLIKILRTHKSCTTTNYKFVEQCLYDTNNIISMAKELGRMKKIIICPITLNKFQLLSHNFSNFEEFTTYGEKHWKKLIKMDYEELQIVLNKLKKSKNSIWLMCWNICCNCC